MRIDVQLLGDFRVTVDLRPVPLGEWRRSRSIALVKLLALVPGNRLQREQAMDALWPDLAPDAAAANLRKAVHYARQALGARDLIKVSGDVLALSPYGELVVDAALFEGEAQAALRVGDA